MINIKDLSQMMLIDQWDAFKDAKEKLLESWEGVFRMVILSLLPVDILAGHFHSTMGRPTKELYSMCGLFLIKEFNNWTMDETLAAYRYYSNIHFALGLDPGMPSMSKSSLERYLRLIVEDEVAMKIFDSVTKTLVELCGIQIDKQRLDSTHLYSDMACYGRTKLMGVVIKKFLRQLKRHAVEDYNNLPEDFRIKYEQSNQKLFGGTGKKPKQRTLVRQAIAEDLYFLVDLYYDNSSHNTRTTYKNMAQVFAEQCEIKDDAVCVKKKTGGDVIQNPSDPDATYDGHKGPGYQVQISETCNSDNEVQLVTAVLPQTAVESDTVACDKMLEQLEERKLLPEEMSCDCLYGTDANVLSAAKRGVELISPVLKGRKSSLPDPTQVNISDFTYDENQQEIIQCPQGHAPISSEYDKDKNQTTTYMSCTTCEKCSRLQDCPAKKHRKSNGNYILYTSPSTVRLTERRLYNQTEAFKDRYRIRSGIEGTNSGIKRRTVMVRLRVRCKEKVFHSVILKITGWNILRASQCKELRNLVRELYEKQFAAGYLLLFRMLFCKIQRQDSIRINFWHVKSKIKELCYAS